jgi:hypothetical protein
VQIVTCPVVQVMEDPAKVYDGLLVAGLQGRSLTSVVPQEAAELLATAYQAVMPMVVR